MASKLSDFLLIQLNRSEGRKVKGGLCGDLKKAERRKKDRQKERQRERKKEREREKKSKEEEEEERKGGKKKEKKKEGEKCFRGRGYTTLPQFYDLLGIEQPILPVVAGLLARFSYIFIF